MAKDRHEVRTRIFSMDSEGDSSGFVLFEDSPPTILSTTSRYEVMSEIGRGGEGIVYLAHDAELKRNVALKILHKALLDQPASVARFQQEAQIISRLQHPGIAQVFGHGKLVDGRPFHAMQLVGGEDMFEILNRLPNNARYRSEAIRAFAKVCDAVAYAHAREIVHLDLKPANFMIGFFGEVHVTDWGTAKWLNANETNRAVSVPEEPQNLAVGGTIQYMCPEQANGESVDKRADVFALGACLCHILTGSAPYSSGSKSEILSEARKGMVEQAHERIVHSHADPILIRLAIRCLQANPDHRPMDGGEVARELSAYEHAALRTFESDMSRFFELSDDLFCIAGLDGFFRRINENFSRVLGYPADTMLASPFIDFVHPDDVEKTRGALSELAKGSHIRRFRNRYRTATGRFVEFEWTARLVEDERLIFAVARDVD